jgi:predicted nucleotidyltransferase
MIEYNTMTNVSPLIRLALEMLLSRKYCAWSPRAVFLYGSHARGCADAFSDIDMLAITDNLEAPVCFTCQGIIVEVNCATQARIHKRSSAHYSDNNNFFANVFRESILLHEDGLDGLALQQEVLGIAGTKLKPPTEKEKCETAVALRRLMDSCQRHARRAGESPTHLWLSRMRADTLMSRSIYMRFWADGLLTGSLPQLLAQARNLYPEIDAAVSSYVAVTDPAQQSEIALHFSKQILSDVLSVLQESEEQEPCKP